MGEHIKSDKNGRLLLLDTEVDDQNFVIFNIYNASIELIPPELISLSITRTNIIAFCSSDHSLVLPTLKLDKESHGGAGLWKFNNSLLPDEDLLYKTYIFLQKNYLFQWISGRANILCKYVINICSQFWAWLLQFFFYAILQSSSFSW